MGDAIGRNDSDDGGDGNDFVCFVAEILVIFVEALHQRRGLKHRNSSGV